ncbi:RNA-directed DNA polymerase, eukaryota, reverse transcriptase zinc-binding domain protein [Tanacetum coccineum]
MLRHDLHLLSSYERSHKGVKASTNSDIIYFFTSAQDGDPLQDDVRLCLADDLKKAQDHNQRQKLAKSKNYLWAVKYDILQEESESDNLFHDHIQGEDENAEDVQMADHLRPMEELLRIPIVGIKNAIVVPPVLATYEFELKIELLDFVSNNSFFGLENDDRHSHIRRFYQITQTLRLNQVPDDVVKLILFSFSLKGVAETWLENEPPNSITSWDDLVSKFLNRFYPHSKTRELRKEIMNFQQVFGETFTEAWERFKDLLRKCTHHGFSLLYQIDFFYNGLSQSDQDSLNTAAGGNLMMRNIQESLTTIENKARVRTFRNKPQVSSSGGTSTQIDAITALTKQVKAFEYHFASMRETYDQNQEAAFQLIQNQMGQLAKVLQERPLGVLPSNTVTDPLAELNVITTMDDLTLDGSFIPHSNFLFYQEKEQEPETITEVVEIASSQSIPLVSPPETPPLSAPKPKENRKPNPHQPSIPYPSRLQEENFQALENPTGRTDHFVYRIDIVDSLCDKFPSENNSLSGNPTLSSDSVVKSPSPFPTLCGDSDSLMEETDTLLSHIEDSFPEYKTFCFDIEEKSSGSTTTRSDYSLPDYDAFYFDDDHIEEKSSGGTTTQSDFSLPEYDSFIFDLMIDPPPPHDRSDSHHEEFTDELAHIISLLEYDRFYFDFEPDPGELTILFEENLSKNSTNDLTIHELSDFPLLLPACDSIFSEEFSEIDPLVSFPTGNKDKVFDPGIFIIKGVQSHSFHINPLDYFSTILVISDFLILTDPSAIETFLSFLFGNKDKVFDPGILLINGIFSLMRKSPHILIDNFLIDKCHILSEISLMTDSVSFHPRDN